MSLSRPRAALLTAVACVSLALAVPALGAASDFTVNTTGDGAKAPAGAGCETATAGECTLRSAIEAANDSSVGTDVISFDPTVFNGGSEDTIAPALLPEITTATTIDGASCNPGSTVPCLNGANATGFALLAVKGGGSTVENLKMTIPGGGFGIRVVGTGAGNPGIAIVDNTLDLTGTLTPITGIGTIGTTSAAGNLIEGNTLRAVVGANFSFPISLRSSLNRVLGNVLEGSGCCQAGITIDMGNNGNRIGGDTEASENLIEGFSGAVSMDGTSGHNDVRRNRGANRDFNFIRGSATTAPTVTGGFLSGAIGTGETGATVRVFLSESESEIGGFLGEAVVNGSGKWEVPYAAVPSGTSIAATQTLAGATSALTQPVATIISPAEEKAEGEAAEKAAAEKAAKERQEKETQEQQEREAAEKGSGGGSGSPNPAPAPSSPAPPAAVPPPVSPAVKITAGPKRNATATTARFRFAAVPAGGARFECRLDGARWAACKSPRTYRKLKPGRHTFRVRAVAGALTGAVTKYQFTVKS
jgi:CSLREA domain-containing protein